MNRQGAYVREPEVPQVAVNRAGNYGAEQDRYDSRYGQKTAELNLPFENCLR